MKSKVTCRAQPVPRLAAASAICATRMLDSSEEATISLYTKAELALVFTTLRDTSFKYTTWYSFNTNTRSNILKLKLYTPNISTLILSKFFLYIPLLGKAYTSFCLIKLKSLY